MWRINLYEALSFVAAFLLIFPVLTRAKRAAVQNAPARNRTDRIWPAAILFALLCMIVIFPGFLRQFSLVNALINSVAWFFGLGLTGLLWVWAVDWILLEFGAERSKSWLVISSAGFGAGFALLMLLPIALWTGRHPDHTIIPLVINAGTAGIWWWSHLRSTGPQLPDVFD